MSSIQSSVPSLSSFQALANTGDAVSLKNGELKSTSATPAKLGIFGKIMQWIRGDSPSKASAETKTKFMEAMAKSYGRQVAQDAVAGNRLDVGNGKALTSREIKTVINKADQLKSQREKIASLMEKNFEKRGLEGEREMIWGNPKKTMAGGLKFSNHQRLDEIDSKLNQLKNVGGNLEKAQKEYQEMKGAG